MGHTWLQKPKIVTPTIEKHDLVGNAIQNMPDLIFVCLKVKAPIQGKLRCDGGQVRECILTVHATICVPISLTKFSFSAALPAGWLKRVWWLTHGVKIANVLLKIKRVENDIKKLIDNAEMICQGKRDVSVDSKLELGEPIWLNEEGKKIFILPSDIVRLKRQPRTLA